MAKIVIVGGGVSGLSAGIYAQLNGHEAIICEKNDVIGGNLTGWQRGDYHIDNCIHWLTGTNPATHHYKMWEELGVLGNVEIFQGESLYTCEHEGERLSLYKDLSKIESEMLRISPKDNHEILSFIKAVRLMQLISGIGGEQHNKKSSFLRTFISTPTLLKYHKLSTLQLAEKFSHPLLKRFFSCFIGDYFSSLALLAVFANYCAGNGGIPQGSSVSMAQRMANRFTQLGGTILTSKEVKSIEIKNGLAQKVEFTDGTNEIADYVVITTDPRVTFGKIINLPMPNNLSRLYEDKGLFRFSSYHCAFACDSEKLPFSGDFVFEIPPKFKRALRTKFLTIREYSHEKDFAPKGKNIIQSITFCDESFAKEFIELKNNPQKYKEKKKNIARLVERLIVKKFPELNGKLTCIDVWTPASYKRYINSEIGSYMSFVFSPKIIPVHTSGKIPKVRNVVLATQWQQAPGGLPIAASEGKNAICTIGKLEKVYGRKRNKQPTIASAVN